MRDRMVLIRTTAYFPITQRELWENMALFRATVDGKWEIRPFINGSIMGVSSQEWTNLTLERMLFFLSLLYCPLWAGTWA
jgi:hypothetical protein